MKKNLERLLGSALLVCLLGRGLINAEELNSKEIYKQATKLIEKGENSVKYTLNKEVKLYVENEFGMPTLFYRKGDEEPIPIATEFDPSSYSVSNNGRYVAWTGRQYGANPDVYIADMSKGHDIKSMKTDFTQNISEDSISIENFAPQFKDTDSDGEDDTLYWVDKKGNEIKFSEFILSKLNEEKK